MSDIEETLRIFPLVIFTAGLIFFMVDDRHIAIVVADAPQFDDITMLCLEYKKRMEI